MPGAVHIACRTKAAEHVAMLVARLGCVKRPKPPKLFGLGLELLISVKVDAGTGFEPVTFRL